MYLKMKFTLLIITHLLILFSCYAQTNKATVIDITTEARNDLETKVINEQLAKLVDWKYYEEPDFDIDSLMQLTSDNLVQYLKVRPFPIDSESHIVKYSSSDSILNIYTIGYNSGGTAGIIYQQIIQWKKNNEKFDAIPLNMSPEFENFYLLSKTNEQTLYLFLGTHKGSSILYCSYAMVIQLKDDSILTNYPAFYDKYSYISYFDYIGSPENNYCIACYDFDFKKQTITFDNLGEDDGVGPPDEYGNPVDMRSGRIRMEYTFNGQQFIER